MRSGWLLLSMFAMLGAYGGGAYLLYDFSMSRMAQVPGHSRRAGEPSVKASDVRARLVLLAGYGTVRVRPGVRSVQVRPNGRVVIRGNAAPRAALLILFAGRVLPAVRANERGQWSVILKTGLPTGSNTLGILAQSAYQSEPVAGDLVRVHIPGRHPKKTVVAYRGTTPPHVQGGNDGVRRRSEALAIAASERFSQLLPAGERPDARATRAKQRKSRSERQFAQAPSVSPTPLAATPASDVASTVTDWLRQSSETYREAARRLSITPPTKRVEEPRPPIRRKLRPRPAKVKLATGSLIETAWGWYGRVSREYDFVIRRLSQQSTQVASRQLETRSKAASKSSKSSAKRAEEERRLRAARRAQVKRERKQQRARQLALQKERRRLEAETRRAKEKQRQAELAARKAGELRRAAEKQRADEARRLAEARDARRRAEAEARWDADVRKAEQAKRLAEAKRADARRRLGEARRAATRRQVATKRAKLDGQRAAALRQAKIAFGIAQEAGKLVSEGKPAEGLFLAAEAKRQAAEALQLARAGPFPAAYELADDAARRAAAARRLALAKRTKAAKTETLAPAPAAKVAEVSPELSGDLIALREQAGAALRLAERAHGLMGERKTDQARWLAAEAVSKAEAVRKRAAVRGAGDASKLARDARQKARTVLRLAVAQRLEAARKLEALRRGPPAPVRIEAPSPPQSVAPKVADKDASRLQALVGAAMQLAKQARTQVDDGEIDAARWLAAEAVQKASTVRKSAKARGLETVVTQADHATRLAEKVLHIARRHRLASERKIADARAGPPPLPIDSAKARVVAVTKAPAKSKPKATQPAKPSIKIASVAPAKRNRVSKKASVAKPVRTRSKKRSAKRATKRKTKRRGKRLARASIKKWVRRSARRKTKRRDRYRRSQRRQRYARARWYVVRRGDSLWRIARRFLGRGERYWAIVRVNKGRLDRRNLDLIYPKQRLRIPRRRS